MKAIVLASNNPGKLAELQTLFAPLGLRMVPQVNLHVPEAKEPYFTFVENALAKARHASLHSGLPALADDAGLCVDAFNGLPGVQTAFYCTQFGYLKSDDNNRKALLEQMANETNRRAALVSTLVAVRNPLDPEPLIAVGRVVGEITHEPRGSNGFGFDPVMFIASMNQTFAEMSEDTKNALSHRGQSARLMSELMRERWLA
ncbi:MAG: RdgB/HAM1 family non-canonical purine NTP pyrophosphatase [Betaproteobacteria bacterium]|nr:RdgB/HAM1 family non-canonical purine NTP pyrophosphatase [Betaproteobacteria bacterium]